MDRAVAADPTVGTVLDVDPERLDEVLRHMGDLSDRFLERLAVLETGFAIAADLADVLAGGRLEFTGRRRFARATQGLDASAHTATVGRMPHFRQSVLVLLAVIVGLALAVGIDIARTGGSQHWLARHGLPSVLGFNAEGERVDIGGRSLYIECRGEGSPTIVLEAGMGGGVSSWAPVIDGLATTTRTCAYDRAGRGRSDPRGPHTVADATDDLVALLDAVGERPPYVIVGHSLGEVYARVLASRHRPAVAGLVLVDGFSVDLEADWIHPLLGELRPQYERQAQGFRDQITAVEDLDWPASEAQLRAADTAGLPIIILRAPRVEPRLDKATNEAIAEAWSDAYGTLSPGHVSYRIAWGAGHIVQADRPDLVSAAAIDVVELVRRTGHAAPR